MGENPKDGLFIHVFLYNIQGVISILFSNCLKCFVKILNDIVNILCTNGKTNCIWFDTLIEKFFFCALAVCCCCRMDNQRFYICNVSKQ